jgi:hypothetical protein
MMMCMATTTYTVLNIDGVPVGTYDDLDSAKSACYDLAREAAAQGDVTNGYAVAEDAEFDGHLATEFV